MSFLYSYKVTKVEDKKLDLHFYITSPDCLGWGEKSIVTFNPDFFALIVLVEQIYDDVLSKEINPSFELPEDRALIQKVIKSAKVTNVANYPAPDCAFDFSDDEKGYARYWGIDEETKDLEHLVQFDLSIEVNEQRYLSEHFIVGTIERTTAFDPG